MSAVLTQANDNRKITADIVECSIEIYTDTGCRGPENGIYVYEKIFTNSILWNITRHPTVSAVLQGSE